MDKNFSYIKADEIETNNRKLALKAAIEGIVLLKNDENCLPIKNKCIALFGAGIQHASKGGTGSGEVNNRFNVSIYDSFKNNGYQIRSEKWLKNYECYIKLERTNYKKRLKNALKGISRFDSNACFWALDPIKENFPVGQKIDEEDFKISKTDTAIYVITRQAGEGKDRLLEKGDYFLSDEEIHNIEFISTHYKNSILLINSGSAVDLKSIEKFLPKAIVFMGQAGEESGNAIFKLLVGEENFSAKLSATWYEDITLHPLVKSYSYLDRQTDFEEYKEGIYVGYRYCDAFNIKPRYYFGYGLSYTKFDFDVRPNLINNLLSLKIKIKNIGNYKGKEVIQVYLVFPQSNIKREKKALVCFKKSKELNINEEEILELSFDITDFSYYDEKIASYCLTKGNYIVQVGNSSNNLRSICTINLSKDLIVEKVKNIAKLDNPFNQIVSNKINEEKLVNPIFEFDYTKFKTVTHTYDYKEEIPDIIKKISDKDLCYFLNGYDAYNDIEKPFVTPGCAGKTTNKLIEKYNIKSLSMADGPAGLRIVPYYKSNGKSRAKGFSSSEKLTLASKYFAIKEKISNISFMKKHYHFATAFPVGIVLAQSFNLDLLYEIGKAVSKEMDKFNIDIWLAPGINIMRFPLCGRNFEYYSEDPLLAGKLASSLSLGVSESKKHSVTFKHYCCNNQEDNRMKCDSRLYERELREIYLKPFKIAIKEGNSKAIMTSYNKVNGIYSNSSYDLINNVLRNEFNYHDLIMTDWGSVDNNQALVYEAIKAGNDLIMPGRDKESENLYKALLEDKIKRSDLEACASRLYKLIKYIKH